MSTHRRLAVLAAGSALALALSAAPAMAAGPMTHVSFPATDNPPITCGDHSYTFTGGEFAFVFRDPSIGAHITARNVWAADGAGNLYRVVGSETYGPTTFTPKLMFVGETGGIADSVNITAHLSPNGTGHWFDIGTCGF